MIELLEADGWWTKIIAWLIAAGGLGLFALQMAKVGVHSLRALLGGPKHPSLGEHPNHGLLWAIMIGMLLPFAAGVVVCWHKVASFEVAADGAWTFRNPYFVTLARIPPGELRAMELLPSVATYYHIPDEPIWTGGKRFETEYWVTTAAGQELAFHTSEPEEAAQQGPRIALSLGYGPDSPCRYERGPHEGVLFPPHRTGPDRKPACPGVEARPAAAADGAAQHAAAADGAAQQAAAAGGPTAGGVGQAAAVTLPAELRPGAAVLAFWPDDGWWYPATLLEPNAAGSPRVRFADGTEKSLTPGELRPLTELPAAALAVQADWQGRGGYWPCTVLGRRGDLVDLRYEDGSTEEAPLTRLRYRLAER